MRNDYTQRPRPAFRGGGMAKRGMGAALRGGGVAKRGMGVALKDGGKADMDQDKALIKKAFKMHDAQEHKGEHTKLDKLKKGGMAKEESKMHEAKESKKKEKMEESKMKKGGRAHYADGSEYPVKNVKLPSGDIMSAEEFIKKYGDQMYEKKAKGGIAKGKKSTAFESGKSGNKPYEAEEAYAKQESGYKKGGRVKKKYGGKC